MLTISPQSHQALAQDYSPRGYEAFKAELVKADWPLFGTLAPAHLDQVVQEAIRQGKAVGMDSVGGVAMFATLIVASRGQPDSVEGFAPVLAVLRDTSVSEELRRHRASAMLTDPEAEMRINSDMSGD